MSLLIDNEKLRELFEEFVKLDIKEYGKPAKYYYYHHEMDSINAIDDENIFQQELDRMKKSGLTKQYTHDKTVEIDNHRWNIKIWVIQCEDLNNNNNKWSQYSKLLIDPLACLCGYLVTGFCYIQLVNKL